MGLFDSISSLIVDTARVVTAPITIVADLADAAVKPVADGLEEISKAVKDLTK